LIFTGFLIINFKIKCHRPPENIFKLDLIKMAIARDLKQIKYQNEKNINIIRTISAVNEHFRTVRKTK